VSLSVNQAGFYTSSLLQEEPWLDHVFGTAVAQPETGYLFLKQIHSTLVLDAAAWTPGLEGDGLTTNQPGLRIAAKSADCVPLLLADPVHRAVAAVHAGWKGTLHAIAARAVDALHARYGAQPENLLAAFGPSIGPCCFQVGPEVASQFKTLFPERYDLDQSTNLDLRLANHRILTRAGLLPHHIDAAPPCSLCGGPAFFSYRRDKTEGRMFAVIHIR